MEDNNFVVNGPPALEPLPQIPLGQLLYSELLKNITDNPFIADETSSKSITYKQVLIKSHALAKTLQEFDCNKTTIIAISSENCTDFCLPVLSSLYIGAPITALNPAYTKDEFLFALNITKPEILFCSRSVCSKIFEIRAQLSNDIKKFVIIDSDDDACDYVEVTTLNVFLRKHLTHDLRLICQFQHAKIDIDDHVAFILYSSGTSGLPKAVMLTHKNLLVKYAHGLDPRFSRNVINQNALCILPFYHAYGLILTMFSIRSRTTVITLKKFDADLFLGCIEKYKITQLMLVPPLAVFLIKSPLVSKYDLSSVNQIFCGAAVLSEEVEKKVTQKFNVNYIRSGYGLTEVTLGVTATPLDKCKTGSCGKLLPFISCKIRDPLTGKSLGPDKIGELCFKGPLVMKGYYNDEEATRNAFTSDGWLKTGDLGYYDDDENFFIVDRLKELIKYKAHQVPPAELEAVLLKHAEIVDAAVVGLPDEDAGELPLAFVVKAADSSLTEKEIIDFVNERVSPQKKLRGGVIFINAIPKNPSGKILRRELRHFLKTHKSKL